MKAVMISIQPKWCNLIANGKKTIGEKIVKKENEVRKTRPNIETPFKCYIYCTKIKDKKRYSDEFDILKCLGNGKVIGEFICDKIEVLEYLTQIPNVAFPKGRIEIVGYENVDPFYNGKIETILSTTLSNRELIDYGQGKPLYAWHISDLKIYDEPKELSEFRTPPCEKGEKACENCKNIIDINTPNGHERECYVDDGKTITRPPQSWQYCEE